MASNSKNQKNRPGQKIQSHGKTSVASANQVKSKTKDASSGKNMRESLDGFFVKHMNSILTISIGLSVILGAFLFDVKISTGGDDSHYIEMANDFLKGRSFPTWHGPLYSIFLSLPMLFFG